MSRLWLYTLQRRPCRIFMVFILGFIACFGYSQPLVYHTTTSDQQFMLKRIKINGVPADSAALMKQLNNSREDFFAYGLLEAGVDSIILSGDKRNVWWHLGPVYRWGQLRSKPEDEILLAEAGVRDRILRKKPLSPASFAKVHRQVLNWCENNGYPFALVKLDSVTVDHGILKAVYVIDRGPAVLFDSAEVKGDARIAHSYLFNYLALKPGAPYSQSSVERIGNRLKELPFVSEARPFEIAFNDSLARPVFYLHHKKASQFNGVIGVQPDNATGKVFINGDLKLRLQNVFGRAELFDLNWSNPQPRSQDLKVKFGYPFLLDLPFGIDADLSLYKKDTIYLEFFRQAGLRYFLRGSSSLRVFAGIRSSNLISTEGYKFITTLPSFADVKTTQYGIGLQLQQLDYRLNPRKGFMIDLTAGAGIRQVTKNSRINAEAYDSVQLRTTQYRLECTAESFIPLGRRGVFNLALLSGLIQSPAYFQNELFRFGGLKSLRGFDEQSLIVSAFAGGRAEFRFILDQNSYLLVFYNQAYTENRASVIFQHDIPYGFGAGITFDTKLGIFSFIYALGSQQDNPVIFRSAKVHFGLVNYF